MVACSWLVIFQAGGKPSTWFPPGRLVEHFQIWKLRKLTTKCQRQVKQASARPKQPEHSKPRPVSYRSLNHTPASSRTSRQANLLESTQETGKGNKPRKCNKAEHDLDSPTKQEQAQQTGATPEKRKQAQLSHSNLSNTSTNPKKSSRQEASPTHQDKHTKPK